MQVEDRTRLQDGISRLYMELWQAITRIISLHCHSVVPSKGQHSTAPYRKGFLGAHGYISITSTLHIFVAALCIRPCTGY